VQGQEVLVVQGELEGVKVPHFLVVVQMAVAEVAVELLGLVLPVGRKQLAGQPLLIPERVAEVQQVKAALITVVTAAQVRS
jgi:hypothetical protein